MADEKKGNTPGKPQEEAILSRLKGEGQTPTGVTSFVGLMGRSPRPGYWLLYLGLDMSRSVEIQEADIVHSEQLAPDQSPFGSLGGTRVFVKQNAQVTSSQTTSQTKDASDAAADEFDLDIRLGGQVSPAQPRFPTQVTCPDGSACRTCDGTCGDDTCPRTQCGTCPVTHCNTCHTQCGTCINTCPNTCPNTCNTCANTCPNTCPNTCANTCPNTCPNTCANTCPNTCRTCHTKCGTCVGDTCPRTQCDTCVTCFGTHCDTCHQPPHQCQ